MISGRIMKQMMLQSCFVYKGNKTDGTHLVFYKAFHLVAHDMLRNKINMAHTEVIKTWASERS